MVLLLELLLLDDELCLPRGHLVDESVNFSHEKGGIASTLVAS